MTSANEIFTPFELGKHTAKLTVEDSESAVVILRPRYPLEARRYQAMLHGIADWKKANNVEMSVLIVPHDFDVFAVEVINGGNGQRVTSDAAHQEGSGQSDSAAEGEGGELGNTEAVGGAGRPGEN